jgi:hypothetical protein
MSNLSDIEKSGEPAGAKFPPILQIVPAPANRSARPAMLGEFLSFKHVEKKVGEGRKAEVRKYDIFNFRVLEVEGIDGVVLGEEYAIFAPGQLVYLLGEMAQKPEDHVGRKVVIRYAGMSKIKDGDWAGKDAHNFKVTFPKS